MRGNSTSDPFLKFRLPLPLSPTTGSSESPLELPPYITDEWLLRLLDLLRLIDVMDRSAPSRIDWQIVRSRLILARSAMDDVEYNLMPCLNEARKRVDEMDEKELNFHANFDVLLGELRRGARDACDRYQSFVDRCAKDEDGGQRDFIAEIFLLPEDQSPLLMRSVHDDLEDEYLQELKFEDSDHPQIEPDSNATASHAPRQSTPRKNKPNPRQLQPQQTTTDPVAFQKQQQHLLELELSTLASRLKSSTLAMHSTLQSQTLELSSFESLAQQNLDSVSSAAQRVEERVKRKKGWRKRLATWSLIGTVVGMWVVCFMVMRTVPKRKIGKVSFETKFRWASWRPWRKIEKREEDESEYYEYMQNVAAERERRRREMLRERERLKQEKRRREQQQQQRQQQQRRRENCEILPDGTQYCRDGSREDHYSFADNSESRAQYLAAERKRSRIEENMANAPIVTAIDSDGEASAEEAAAEEKRQMEEERRRRLEEERLKKEAEDLAAAREERDRTEEEARAKEAEAAARAAAEKQRFEDERQSRLEEEARIQKEKETEAKRLRLEQEAREAAARAAAEEKRRLEEEERQSRLEEEARIQKENEAKRLRLEQEAKKAADRVAAESKRRLEEEERLRRLEEEARIQKEKEEAKRLRLEHEAREAAARAAAEKHRLEEEERQSRLEEEARIQKEKEAEAEHLRLEHEAREAAARAAAEEKRRLEEEERLRQLEEKARLQKEAEERAAAERAAAEKERLERERLEAIERETRLAEERKRANIERVRKQATEDANAALELAKQVHSDSNTDILPSDIRYVAGQSKNDLLAHYLSKQPDLVDASDGSGWRPIHEAARGGNLAGLQLLIDSGSDLSARTGRAGTGGTALWWALQRHGEESDVVRLLRSYDAPKDGPEM